MIQCGVCIYTCLYICMYLFVCILCTQFTLYSFTLQDSHTHYPSYHKDIMPQPSSPMFSIDHFLLLSFHIISLSPLSHHSTPPPDTIYVTPSPTLLYIPKLPSLNTCFFIVVGSLSIVYSPIHSCNLFLPMLTSTHLVS